jgi:molecular chaperone DnaK (HSP70)
MSEVSCDFGTSNTLLARHNETTGQVEAIRIPGITMEMPSRLTSDGREYSVPVIPSLINYSETETLIGDQVLSRGLTEHQDTIRWMKRSIACGQTSRKKTAQGLKSPSEAGEDFLRRLLTYASNQISFEEDAFTFTAPVEVFEHFQDWLLRLCESLNIQRVRLMDEPTACIFGYHGATREQDRFVIFDFGGGTLDVSAIRLDRSPDQARKAIQLGQAGCDLGGMDIDLWLAADFAGRHGMNDYEKRELEAVMLRQAEQVKIQLSDPQIEEADLTILNDRGRIPRLLKTSYSRSCGACERGGCGEHQSVSSACLGCLLSSKGFLRSVRETLDRSLENAAVKVGLRRDEVTRLFVTGGTSLVPVVRNLLNEYFRDRVVYDHPFDAVVKGACQGIVEPVLQHDYAIEGYNPERKEYEFKPMFRIGTEYPTEGPKRYYTNGSHEGQTRIGIKIFEVSRVKRSSLNVSIVDERGILQEESRVHSDYQHRCLNTGNPTFIIADPPINIERDKKRFLCSYKVDGNRRLLLTAIDNLTGKTLFDGYPVVRL